MTMLNAEQALAAGDLERNQLLVAGAGCGKTRTLVERYINILREGRADVSRIVAITFTEKAANELKERIHGRLRSLHGAACGRQERKRWKRHLAAVESARISTIHGFCTEILREFPIQAGVDPGFSVIEESEAGELAAEAVDEFLRDAAAEGDGEVTQVLVRFGIVKLADLLRESIGAREDMAYLSETLVGDDADPARIGRVLAERTFERAERKVQDDFTSHAVMRSVAVLAGRAGPRDDKLEAMRAAFVAAWDARAGEQPASPAETCRAIADIGMPGGRGRKAAWGGDPEPVREALRCVVAMAREHAATFDALDGEDWTARARDMLVFMRLHRGALDRYTALKRRRGVIDFDDQIILVRDLLRKSSEVCDALAGRCRFILVDEFQDTDHVQAEIVERLAARGANLFVVGDAEQSIYHFRGAEVEVFTEKQIDFADGRQESGVSLTLSKNYRSLGHVLEFLNVLFGNMMPGGRQELPWRIPHRALSAERESPHGRVEIMCARSDENMHRARQIEARAIASRIREMCESGVPKVYDEAGARGPVYGDVAILLGAMSNIDIYESYLAGAGIPYHTGSGRTFYRRKEVRDLVNLLRFIADPHDTVALVGALRSPLFAVSDDFLAALACNGGVAAALEGFEAAGDASPDAQAFAVAAGLVRRLRALKNRLPVRRIIDVIFEETGYLAALAACFRGKQQVLNAMKVRESAAAFDESGAGVFEDFVERVSRYEMREEREGEAVSEEEAEQGAVQVMTVHAAKGLEFPIVIVADMGWSRHGGGRGLAVDRSLGLSLPREGEGPDGFRRVLTSLAGDRERAEDERVFYVAATRARDHLILSGAAAGKTTGWIAAALESLGIDPEKPGDYGFEGVTVEYSTPREYRGASAGERGAALEAMRERILGGGYRAPRVSADAPLVSPLPQSVAGPKRLSASAVSDFAQCPLLFELRHLRRLPADHVLRGASGSAVPRRLVGTVLHEVLERSAPGGGLLDTLEDVLASRRFDGRFSEDIRGACLPVLRRFEACEVWRRLRTARGERERGFCFMLDGCILEGKIDLLLEGAVVDFKSDDVAAESVEERAEGYRAQMDVYALAAERILGRAPGKAAIIFLRPCVEVAWEYGADELDRARQRVASIIDEMRKGAPFMPAPGCEGKCDYASLCGVISAIRSTQG